MEKNLTILLIRVMVKMLLLGMLMHLGSTNGFANETDEQKLNETYIDIQSPNQTTISLLSLIEAQTDFNFSYPSNLRLDHKFQFKKGKTDLESLLLELAKQLHLQFKQINYTIAISLVEKEKTAAITVQGKVTDSEGAPLPGATIVEMGTTNGTISDLDGSYSITIGEGATLIYSFIGYVTYTTDIGDRSLIDVVLQEDANSLDEVVVVGYGEQKRVTVTGAVSAISGKEMVKSPTTNLSNSFAGRIAGITALERSGEPGSSGAEILIRGVSTLGNNSPLLVIDGIPSLIGGLNRIDPNDVESVSVLKDASASIYGARAANGVILITTKRGQEGKPVINYSFNQGFVSPTRMPEMADAPLYAQLTNEILGYAGQPEKYTQEDIQKYRDGSDPWTHPNTDWIGAVIKPVSLQNRHNLSLRGGSENIRYFVSIGSLYEDAVYRNSATNYSQQNIRINLDGKVNEYLDLKFDVQGRSTKRNYAPVSAGSIFRFIQRGRPTETAIWPNGLPGPDIEQGNNPVVTTTEEAGYNNHDIALGNVLLGYKFKIPGVEELFLDGNYSASKEVLHRKNFVRPWTLYTWGGLDGNGEPQLLPGERGVSDPELRERYDLTTQVLFNSKINYERNFGKHFITAFIGYEQNLDYGSGINGYRRNFISPVVDQLFAGGQDLREITGSAYEGARRNYFGRASYRMEETYMVDFSFRFDGSQNFPKDKRYGFFPGVSAGWILSNEEFLKENSSINFLKLRASWGRMGNDQVANFQYLSNYGFGSGAIFGDNLNLEPSIYPTRIANPNITWEVANTTNIAVESEFFNGALGVELDYFYSKRTNILIPRSASIPEYTGMVLPDENLGEVENKGFDLQLTHQNQIGEWDFVFAGNVSYARNKILFWDESDNIPDYQKYTGSRIGSDLYYNTEGVFRDEEHVNSLPHWSGAREGDLIFQDFNGDGQIDALDRVRHKPDIPELNFGLNMNINYRNFNFTMLWQGAAGASQYVRTESGLIGNFPLAFVEDRWTESNRNTDVPRVFDSREYWVTQRNSYWLWDTDYLRLKTVQFGYSFNRSFLEKLKVQNLNVFVSGQNLFTIDKVKIFDPEMPGGSGHYYPQVRIVNLGLNVTL